VFQNDRVGVKLIDELGAETLMWGSDYPHSDGTWPESTKVLNTLLANTPRDVVHKITCENAARLYGIEAPAGRESAR